VLLISGDRFAALPGGQAVHDGLLNFKKHKNLRAGTRAGDAQGKELVCWIPATTT